MQTKQKTTKVVKRVAILAVVIIALGLAVSLTSCVNNEVAQERADKAAEWAITQVEAGYVSDDITLPTRYGQFGAELTWVSDKPAVISNTGEFTAPQADTPVRLTVTARYRQMTASKYIIVTAKAATNGGGNGNGVDSIGGNYNSRGYYNGGGYYYGRGGGYYNPDLENMGDGHYLRNGHYRDIGYYNGNGYQGGNGTGNGYYNGNGARHYSGAPRGVARDARRVVA